MTTPENVDVPPRWWAYSFDAETMMKKDTYTSSISRIHVELFDRELTWSNKFAKTTMINEGVGGILNSAESTSWSFVVPVTSSILARDSCFAFSSSTVGDGGGWETRVADSSRI